MSKDICVVTVNHDTPEFIDLNIRAVHLYGEGCQHVVIDNGSKPNTIMILDHYAKAGWISLLKRNLTKCSGAHGDSLDWFLQLQGRDLKLVCLLDSDAHPVANGWLKYLQNKLGAAAATGFAHFRDETMIHPSCMMLRLAAYQEAGSPSFILKAKPVLIDTGIGVCRALRDIGHSLVPLHVNDLGRYVRHRWCGTRCEATIGDKLDGKPKTEWREITRRWMLDPIVKTIENQTRK